MSDAHAPTVGDDDYRRLLEFRTGLRRFLRWSEEQAAGAGLTPAQHQLLLAIRGHPDPRGPTVRAVADYLLSRHNSTVELVDRAADAGLVKRIRDREDHRAVRLRLTANAERRLAHLSAVTLAELDRLGPQLRRVWRNIDTEIALVP
jgi:DNA-binding MarR family transcriptional regulator